MMKTFGNLSLGKKLFLGFTAVILILVILSVISFTNFSKQHQATNWNKHTYEVMMEFQILLEEMLNMETGQRGFALTGNEASLEPFISGKANFDQHYDNVKELTSDNPQQQELLAELKTVQQEWLKIAESSIEHRRNVVNGIGTMDDIIAEEQAAYGKESFDKFREIIAESTNIESTLLQTRLEEAESLKKSTDLIIIFGTAFSVLVALAIAYFITKIITRPINEIKTVAQQIADGNLDIAINKHYQDEVGDLSDAFTIMSDNLNEVIYNINSSTDQVTSGSRQLSDSSTSLSQGSAEQASSIEELTSSMEEISSQTKNNAQNANQANILAEKAQENAAQGNKHMEEMLQAMDEINNSSANISKIIKVIDEIAFQTNILALNAAVEAARAGQHGRGFAVVAEEVRNLAQRAADAAKETTTMIEGSIDKVEDGTKIATETAEALHEIVDAIGKVTALVSDIDIASNEQASKISQINEGILQVSRVVQTNSATSQEIAAASEELASQAELLKEQVSKFNLKKTHLSSYNGTGDIDPHVLKMLGDMYDRQKIGINEISGNSYEPASNTQKEIELNSNEFGKY